MFLWKDWQGNGKTVDTVEDKIQSEISTGIDGIITPKIELAIRSIKASSGRDTTSIMASSELSEHLRIIDSFENVSERNNTLHMFNINDETLNIISDEVSELSVPGTHLDRQPHTHHNHGIVYTFNRLRRKTSYCGPLVFQRMFCFVTQM